ncbi:hypothetical protein FHS29_005228 [Saccharothrix tamanrassetensis]|uniref:Uncharacterized protein n=1 Tax=Saccharothrix tamanrassetensis TaxID=1051531 RepID=A0A841CNA3_9PSEU|nr:hypothetical protein [Saccharothrix tamanrassetensis]MBB5958620.1 hypothetical protein [Saccharothrix tamanrassetensis]
MRFELSLARKLMRNRALAWSSTVAGVTAAVLTALFITLQAFPLSGAQVVERDLGRFDTKADLSAVFGLTPGNADLVGTITSAARRAGASDAMVSVTSLDIRAAVLDPPVTKYVEADWAAGPFPERFSLVTGRWPERPGEVVLSGSMWPGGETVSVLAGNHTFRVVGTADDRYSDWETVLAGRGSFAGIGVAGVTAYATLYWGGKADRDRVVEAVGSAIGAPPAELTGGITDRRTELAREARSSVERFPLVHRIPALALPLLSVLTVLGLTRRRSSDSLAVLTSLGIPRPRAVAGVGLAITAWTMISTVLGVAAGVGLGVLARRIVARWKAEPLPELPGLWSPVGQLLLITAAACLLAAVVLGPRRNRPAATALVRRCAAIVTCGVIVFQVARLDGIPQAMLLTGTIGVAVLLAAPDLVGGVIGRLPGTGARLRLGRQRLLHNRGRAVAAVAVLTAVLAAPVALLTLVATDAATQEARSVPLVPPHQVVLSGVGGFTQPPPPEAVEAVTRRVDFAQPPIRLRLAEGVLAVDTPEEAGRLTNRPLTTAEAELLRGGGVLAWNDLEPSWRATQRDVLLTGTARGLGLPLTDGGIVFTGVPDADAVAAQQAILDARLDHGLVGVHEAPSPPFVPTTFYAAVAGLALVALLATMAVARSQVGTLRTYLGRLITIGLPSRWARQVLLIETAVVVGVSTLLAPAIAVPSIIIAAWRIDALTLRIPWPHIGVLVGAFYLATVAATLVASRHLRATDLVRT